MKQKTLFTTCLFFGCLYSAILQAQPLTLRRSIEIGIENNLSLRDRTLDIKKQQYAVSESRAKLLPVINAFGSYTDNVGRGTSISDGTSRGIPYIETQGMQYTTNGGVQLALPLYNQTIYTGIFLNKKIIDINRLSYEQGRQELIMQICKLYYLGQTTIRQIELVSGNIVRLEELIDITRAFHDNGMALEVDVKRVEINLENLKVQKSNAEAMYEQQLNLLRYTIGIQADTLFTLTPIQEEISETSQWNGLSDNLPELNLLQTQKEVIDMQKKAIVHGYIPSLSFVTQLAYTNYTDRFKNYFHSNTPVSLNKWYNSYYWGISLQIPIFDGLDKHYKMKKANVDYLKANVQLENTRQQMETQYKNAMNEWMNSQRTYKKLRNNYLLAEDVYSITVNKYKEGVSSMTEILQDELRISEAQNNYITAHYNYKISELSLLKLSDRLSEIK